MNCSSYSNSRTLCSYYYSCCCYSCFPVVVVVVEETAVVDIVAAVDIVVVVVVVAVASDEKSVAEYPMVAWEMMMMMIEWCDSCCDGIARKAVATMAWSRECDRD